MSSITVLMRHPPFDIGTDDSFILRFPLIFISECWDYIGSAHGKKEKRPCDVIGASCLSIGLLSMA